MKPNDEIRRQNLLLLIKEAGTAAELSKRTGVAASMVSQYARGVAHSAGGRPRKMGDDVARQLEHKMGKPRGWIDADHSALSIASDLTGREGQLIGLFRLLHETEQTALIVDLTARLRHSCQEDSTKAPVSRKAH